MFSPERADAWDAETVRDCIARGVRAQRRSARSSVALAQVHVSPRLRQAERTREPIASRRSSVVGLHASCTTTSQLYAKRNAPDFIFNLSLCSIRYTP
jgi:hypothetical protein